MAQRYTTNHGLPAYDAARWLAPPPPVRHIRSLPGGVSCLVQAGASAQRDVTQEAIVKDRGAESLLLFPDGTTGFDLHAGATRVQPGAAFGMALMGPDTVARWVSRPTRARMVQVHFPQGVRTALAGGRDTPGFSGDYLAAPGKLAVLLSAFCADCDDAGATPLLIETYVALIVQKLAAAAPSPGGRLAPWQMRRAVDLLCADLGRQVSLAELSRAVGLSPHHFVRAFKRSAGEPPHRYQMRLRVDRAKALLAATDLSIPDIAALVGYEDASYFARLFRRLAGTTPSQYRRECR